jgi:hypothetical protein
MKLELERIYENYCNSNLDSLKGEDEFIEVLCGFVKFRLNVSGGKDFTMGRIGCESVKGFLDEIFLFENMMCDWGGEYRGDLCYETFERFENILNESSLSEDIKNEIIKNYKEEYGMNEDED